MLYVIEYHKLDEDHNLIPGSSEWAKRNFKDDDEALNTLVDEMDEGRCAWFYLEKDGNHGAADRKSRGQAWWERGAEEAEGCLY